MVSWDNHSWAIQGWPAAVNENVSTAGMVCVFQMISPVFRCHHISGSLKRARTVSTARTTSMPASITGNENSLRAKDGARDSGTTVTLGSADSCNNMNFFGIRVDRSKQPVQIGPRDIQAAGGQRFVALALLDGGGRQLQFVIAQQP